MINERSYSVQSNTYVVAPNAVVGVTALAGQVSTIISVMSGGSAYCGGVSLAAGGTHGFLVVNNPIQNPWSTGIKGTFYLAAGGATAIVLVMRSFGD